MAGAGHGSRANAGFAIDRGLADRQSLRSISARGSGGAPFRYVAREPGGPWSGDEHAVSGGAGGDLSQEATSGIEEPSLLCARPSIRELAT